VKAAAQDRADKVAAATSSRLLKPGGIATTTVNSGQQWDAPNGWAPLQWVAGRVAELRAREGLDGCDLALPEKRSAYLRPRKETGREV
jgi:hypothetical protein